MGEQWRCSWWPWHPTQRYYKVRDKKKNGEHDNTNERTTAPFPLFSSLISFFYLFSSSFFPLQHTNRVAVLVAKEGVCVHVYIAVRRNERTSTTFFAFSLASYCCNSSHQFYSNSNNYRTGKAKTQIYLWRRHHSSHSKSEYHANEARRIFLHCFPQGRCSLHNTTYRHRHTQTGVSINVLYMCVAKTSRALLLSICQHQEE
jgi:hypothetical protein